MEVKKHGRYWVVYDGETLVCVTVYKKGALEMARRLANPPLPKGVTNNEPSTLDKDTHAHP